MISNDALTKSLSGFAEYARLNGLRISTSEVIDGVSACTVLTPLSLQELKDVLRPCLIKNPASLEKYEKIYWEYFRSDTKITPSLVASLAVLKNQQKHGKNNYEIELLPPTLRLEAGDSVSCPEPVQQGTIGLAFLSTFSGADL